MNDSRQVFIVKLDSFFRWLRAPIGCFNAAQKRLQKLIENFTIAQKIGYGYSLVIGIAAIGATLGLTVGEYYKRQAQENLVFASQKQTLLSELERGGLGLQLNSGDLLNVLGKSLWVEYEIQKFRQQFDLTQDRFSKFNALVEQHPDRIVTKTSESEQLHQYNKTMTAYFQLMQPFWQSLKPIASDPEKIPVVQQKVLDFLRKRELVDLRGQFEEHSQKLRSIVRAATDQQIEALQELKRADALRLQIIAASLLLSAAIAILLAIYTSRAIARPLQAVNEVAQQVVQDADFELQVTISAKDEVGSLAHSLNQLIQWVGEYTDELHRSRQMLEHRSQELTETLQNLQEMQTQLIQTEKMSSLGQMVAGIAHEINNPVNFICGNLVYATEGIEDLLTAIAIYQDGCQELPAEKLAEIEDLDLDFLKSDLPGLITSMHLGTDRIQKIVRSLRNFSRLDEADRKEVDLHEGLDNTLLILQHRLKRGVKTTKKYGELPLVSCYPAQLNQVFMNILTNALDALLEDDRQPKQLTIETARVADDWVEIKIRDSGPGMLPTVQEKLFDPFFTTKPVGKGTGLGLSISYQIIEKHQGRIEVTSAVGKGTEFAIALPLQTD